jgi:hypothetical protein
MPGKYVPLEKYLSSLPITTGEIRLSFEQIEKILLFRLPASAYEDSRWWEKATEANHVSSRAWSNAGWKMASVDVETKQVRFVRENGKNIDKNRF